jgi:hypothetical protein
MSNVPQFFKEQTVASPSTSSEATNRTLYKIPSPDPGGGELLIMVEGIEGTGNVPRNATSFTQMAADKLDLEKQLSAAAGMARTAIDAMRKLTPGEVEIEFGVELGGETGIPLITKGEAKANFKITLKWKESARSGSS